MYKKILSMMLAMLIVCGALAFSVSAYTPSLESLFRDPFIEYVQQNGSSVDEETLHINYIGSAGKCSVYRAYYGEILGLESQQIIGDYRFTYGSLVGDEESNPTGLYAWDEFGFGILTLKEAYDKGYADLDALYNSEDYNRGIYPLTETEKEAVLKEKCKEAFIKEYNIATEDENVYVRFAVQFEHYAVFRAHNGSAKGKEVRQGHTDYWLYSEVQYGDEKNPFGLYTLDNYGNVDILGKVIDSGLIEMEELYPLLSDKWCIYLNGDVNNDKKLTIKDATLIQKYLVKLPEAMDIVENHPLGEHIMDYDYNSATTPDVDIKDVTRIQQKLAGYFDYEERQPFEYGQILVFVSTEDEHVYTLEDFPEYDFDNIERGEYATYMYTLEFRGNGKDSVIEAINSLKHREGKDIEYICPNYLYYSDV